MFKNDFQIIFEAKGKHQVSFVNHQHFQTFLKVDILLIQMRDNFAGR